MPWRQLAESRPWRGRTPARYGLLEEAVAEGGSVERRPRLIPSESGAGAATALQFPKGPTPMMYNLSLPVTAPVAGAVILAAVYVMSKDPGRRSRAWQLLKLLLRR